MKHIITSHSLDNLFNACPRKFELLALYDKRPARESGFAADVGTALHEAVQSWLVAKTEGVPESEAENAGVLSLMKWYPWEMELEQHSKIRSYGNTLMLYHALIRSSDWDDWELLSMENGDWAVEIPFLIKHVAFGVIKHPSGREYDFRTQGKMDFVMKNRKTGEIRVRDLKTTIVKDDLLEATYKFSGQQVGYGHVVHAMLGVNPNEFTVDYIVGQFKSGDFPTVRIIEIEKSAETIDDYWRTKYDMLNRVKNYLEAGWFPRTNSGCTAWQRTCSCFTVCHRRDDEFIQKWYRDIESEDVKGYDYVVELEI